MGFLAVNVKALRKNIGISQAELGSRVNVGATTINNIESGYLTAPDVKLLEKLAETFFVSVNDLLHNASPDVGESTKMIHVVTSISSDNPYVEIDKIVETEFMTRDDARGYDFVGLKMPDKSMIEEAIKENANVIIKRTTSFENGDMVAATYNGHDAVIRLYYSQGDKIVLKAANSSGLYPDIVLDARKDDFNIIGIVIHWTNFAKKK